MFVKFAPLMPSDQAYLPCGIGELRSPKNLSCRWGRCSAWFGVPLLPTGYPNPSSTSWLPADVISCR